MLNTMPKRDARSLSHEASAELRRAAIRMIEDGRSQKEVASALDVHFSTVCRWVKAYRRKGERLFEAREAPGAPTKLSEKQILQLRRVIIGKNPDQLSFGPKLWTLPIIAQLVESKFGVILHATTIARLLHRIGVTPQKPVRRAFQRDEAEVESWIKKEFPKAVREMRRKQAVMLFIDEAGVHEDHPVGTTWGERGKTPVVKVSGQRRRTNVISAVSPRGRLWFRCYAGNLTATRYVEFLRDLLHDVRGPVVLIHDRHPAHRAAAVRRFVAEQPRLSIYELPAYAPDKNPDEHIWSILKGLYRSDPLKEHEDFNESVHTAMNQIAGNRKLVKSVFDHPEVAYVKEALNW